MNADNYKRGLAAMAKGLAAMGSEDFSPDTIRKAYQVGWDRRKGGKGPGNDMPEQTATRDLVSAGILSPSGPYHYKLIDAYVKGWKEVDSNAQGRW